MRKQALRLALALGLAVSVLAPLASTPAEAQVMHHRHWHHRHWHHRHWHHRYHHPHHWHHHHHWRR